MSNNTIFKNIDNLPSIQVSSDVALSENVVELVNSTLTSLLGSQANANMTGTSIDREMLVLGLDSASAEQLPPVDTVLKAGDNILGITFASDSKLLFDLNNLPILGAKWTRFLQASREAQEIESSNSEEVAELITQRDAINSSIRDTHAKLMELESQYSEVANNILRLSDSKAASISRELSKAFTAS